MRQAGGAAGIFAGAGGRGGDRCGGVGFATNFNGVNGQDCRVLGSHAFAGQLQNTGGRGSQLFPASGLNTDLIYPAGFTIAYCGMAAAGGGGGGLLVAGGLGRVVGNNINDPINGVPPRLDFMGPPANGGVLVPTYGCDADAVALARLRPCFPNREVIGIDCSGLIHQYGSLHCVTMQIPKAP